MLTRCSAGLCLLFPLIGITSGCGFLAIFVPPEPPVRVEVFNDSGFDIAPDIRFDSELGAISATFPRDTLGIEGGLVPGEFVEFEFDCFELAVIFSDETEIFIGGESLGIAEPSLVIERTRDFDCGDFIRFRFISGEDFFEIEVSVNGEILER